jgi:TRAP-type uncharacterized transport system fused permease subunit
MIEPLSLMSIALIHIGSKYLSLELTEQQKEMLKHPLSQIIILTAIIYASTKDMYKTVLLVLTIYIFIYVIFNENHEMSIILPNNEIKKHYINSFYSEKNSLLDILK